MSIKVDREERPDVDRVYMSFVQSTTGSGGWPMSVFLTPELKPFFGGTYFPPTSRWGRPGFTDLLGELARVWKNDRPRVEQAAAELLERLKMVTGTGGHGRGESALAGADALDVAVEQYQKAFDERNGGFGDAPKFPRPSELLFLLREHARRTARGDLGAGAAAHGDGHAARDGARRDARSCRRRLSPLLRGRASGASRISRRCSTTRRSWCSRISKLPRPPATTSMPRSPRTRSCTSCAISPVLKAASIPPKTPTACRQRAQATRRARKSEGAFYIWSDAEIGAIAGRDAAIVRRRFGIEPDGNAPQDPQGEFTGKNLLYIAQSIEDIATRAGVSPEGVVEALDRARAEMFAAREQRPRPHLDDKVLTAWNGLMIAAFARAARVLPGSPAASRYLAAAKPCRVVHQEDAVAGERHSGSCAAIAMARPPSTRTPKTTRTSSSASSSCFRRAATRSGSNGRGPCRTRRTGCSGTMQDAGWFSTSGSDPTVLLRLKEDYDGAEPAAGSVAVLNTLTLESLLGGGTWLSRAERTLARFGPRIGGAGRVVPMMMCGLSAWHAEHSQIVVVGDPAGAGTLDLQRAVAARYRPFAVVLPVAPGAQQEAVARLMPFVGPMGLRDGRATAYVCQDFACREPVTDAAALTAQL